MDENLNIKLQGNIFENNLDLRDIVYFGKKITNLVDKSYQSLTKSTSTKNKYKILTKNITHSSLNIELLLDYGIAIAPILLENPMSVSQVITKSIEYISKVGETFKKDKEEEVNLMIQNSTITNLVIGNNNNLSLSIPTPVYQTMLNIDNDIKDINKKIESDELDCLKINDKEIMTKETIRYYNKGARLLEKLKEEIDDNTYQATLQIYELNKNNLTAKAVILSHNMFDIEAKQNVDLIIPNNCIDDIIIALTKNSIKVTFEAIIENTVSKKILKKIKIIECEDTK